MSIDLSLDRLNQLVKHLPPFTRPTIHVAGTNGKGSVSALLTSILLASHKPSESQFTSSSDPSRPFRIGRYNSPHLTSILDSITINNIPVSRSVYDQARKEVEDADQKHDTHLSGFEILTLTALRIFEDEQVDIVVLEVGMGGRLDATNIVPTSCILISALTAVDLDHQAFLGNTITKISQEKAGIAREGKPFVLGNQAHDEVQEVVRRVVGDVGGQVVKAVDVRRAEEVLNEGAGFSLLPAFSPSSAMNQGAPGLHSYPGAQSVIASLPCFPTSPPLHTLLPLHGAHQLDNLGTALGIISALLTHDLNASTSHLNLQDRITPETIAKGIQEVSWPGRLSFHTVDVPLPQGDSKSTPGSVPLLVLADGAHNPASAKTLGAYIDNLLELTLKTLDCSSWTSPEPISVPVPITFILSLSHSPPKTPLQTLAPMFAPVLSSLAVPSNTPSSPKITLTPSLGIALLPFTPPDGMPWVKPVPTSIMRGAVATLVPGLEDEDVWVADEAGPAGLGESEELEIGKDRNSNEALERALTWAAQRHSHWSFDGGGGGKNSGGFRAQGEATPGLVVLAGSLYLVADFYRMLEGGPLRA